MVAFSIAIFWSAGPAQYPTGYPYISNQTGSLENYRIKTYQT